MLAAGITSHGLAVACRQCPTHGGDGSALAAVFAEPIIGGSGAIVIPAADGGALAEAVRRKLILEISGLALPDRRPAAAERQASASAGSKANPPAALAAIRARH